MTNQMRKRGRLQKEGKRGGGPVVYWMSRDQRVNDNWALLFAQEEALWEERSLAVVFCLVPEFLGATIRHFGFLLKGLESVQASLRAKNISFHLLLGNPAREIPGFVKKTDAALLVTDFNPLAIKRSWEQQVAEKITVPFHQVDAHNIVPCWEASIKQEYGAYTIRPKLHRLLPQYLESFPELAKMPTQPQLEQPTIVWKNLPKQLNVDTSVAEVEWIKPGEKAAAQALNTFLGTGLQEYAEGRNDPNRNAQSHLSPYLHFGHIAAQRIALNITRSDIPAHYKEAFLEELVVRRELSDNFCHFQSAYTTFDGFPAWAQKTLNEHRKDKREYLYSFEDFNKAATHDDLWNAAQAQMTHTGKMHGYMRMYWAKKILEWSVSPEEAQKIAIALNDRYELDGRDPNGYAGIAWSIGGVHDRAWGERNVFGKIRFMNFNGCASKFDVKRYIQTWLKKA